MHMATVATFHFSPFHALTRQYPHLPQHADGVHDDAGVFDFSFFEAVDDDAPDFDGAAGSGDADEFGAVSAGPFEAGHDFFAFGDLFFDDPMHVGESGAEGAEDVFQSLQSGALAGQRD